MPRWMLRRCTYGLLLLVGSGCSSARYLWQAGRGQMWIQNHARPIVQVLRDEKVSPAIRTLLGEITDIKRFGEEQGLVPTQNYVDYVALPRSAAVYVVSACRPLEFREKVWKFPLVGSFPYLGWFDYEAAREFANTLRKDGWDVDLRGASAYSTLGWFKDPVLSTMMTHDAKLSRLPPETVGSLVDVILHESVHRTLYITGQSFFNETLASFVAERLTPEYLQRTRGEKAPELQAYRQMEHRAKQRREYFLRAYTALAQLYAQDLPAAEAYRQKNAILDRLRAQIGLPPNTGVSGINNATLIQYRTYHNDPQAFLKLLAACQESYGCFFNHLRRLKDADFAELNQREWGPLLERLLQ